MLSRPSIFDPRYQGLETKELLRQVERDKILYDTMEATRLNNTSTTNTVFVTRESADERYTNYINDLFDLDELKIKKGTKKYKEIVELKNKYVELSCLKSHLTSKYYDTFGVNFFLFGLMVGFLALFNIPLQIVPNNIMTIFSITFILTSIILPQKRKANYKIELDNTQKEIDKVVEKLWEITEK